MQATKETFFTCASCGVELTDFLVPVPEHALRLESDEAAVDAGQFLRVSSPWTYADFVTARHPSSYVSRDGAQVAFSAADYLLNIADVRHFVMPNAKFGCCGLQPRGELNACCPNGHPIGTVHSDCWAAHVIRLAHQHVQAIAA